MMGASALSLPDPSSGADGEWAFVTREWPGASVRAITMATLMREMNIPRIDLAKMRYRGRREGSLRRNGMVVGSPVRDDRVARPVQAGMRRNRGTCVARLYPYATRRDDLLCQTDVSATSVLHRYDGGYDGDMNGLRPSGETRRLRDAPGREVGARPFCFSRQSPCGSGIRITEVRGRSARLE